MAERAAAIGSVLMSPSEADTLLAAAWLHDIGYVPALQTTGFHPLGGARYLAAHGWPETIIALVAHHSGADYLAAVRGLDRQLADFPPQLGPVDDALTYADQTIGPDGEPMTLDQRIAEMLRRHGPDSPNAAANPRREPAVREAVRRVERRLARR